MNERLGDAFDRSILHEWNSEPKYHAETWTHEIDETRVFATTMGHTNEVFKADVFLDTLASGILWAAGKLDTN